MPVRQILWSRASGDSYSSFHRQMPFMLPNHHTTPQKFYGPFSGTIRVSRCQNRTSGLYGARKD